MPFGVYDPHFYGRFFGLSLDAARMRMKAGKKLGKNDGATITTAGESLCWFNSS